MNCNTSLSLILEKDLQFTGNMGTPDEKHATDIPKLASASQVAHPNASWKPMANALEQFSLFCVCSKNSFDNFDMPMAAATRNGLSNWIKAYIVA